MEVEIVKTLSVNDYKYLVASVGWKDLKEEQIKRGLEHSMCIVVAKENEKIVGMGRLVGDFGCHGLLTDIIVHPDYQGKGLGSKIVLKIKEFVENYLNSDEQFLIELCPSYGKREFYEKLGFKYKPFNMDGMYLWIKKDE